jgi:hypothetical protein
MGCMAVLLCLFRGRQRPSRARGFREKKKPDLEGSGFLLYESQKLAAGAAFFAFVAAAAGARLLALFGIRAARAGRLLHVA